MNDAANAESSVTFYLVLVLEAIAAVLARVLLFHLHDSCCSR